MIWFLVFMMWAGAFFAHEHMQIHNAVFFKKTKISFLWARVLRIVLPLLALTLSLYTGHAKGILFWLGLGAIAGLMTAIALAYYKHRISPPAQHRQKQNNG